MKKLPAAVLILFIAAGGLFAAWRARGDAAAKNDGPVELYGNIDVRQVRLAFRVGGRIQEALLDEGDPVAPGVPVARLDGTPYREALTLARARRDAAAAALEKAIAGPRPGEIEEARAKVAELAASLEIAELTFARYDKLVATNAITREAYDQAVAARDAARGRLKAGTEALNLLLEGTRGEDVAIARAELRAADAAAAAALTSLSDTELIAPSRGVVVSRVREPGSIVAAGETVAVVTLDEPVWARIYVPEPLLGLVAPGTEAWVRTDGAPDRPYRGVVGFVSPVAEFTPKTVETPELRTALVYRARVVVDEPDAGLRQGMPVTVEIPRRREPRHDR